MIRNRRFERGADPRSVSFRAWFTSALAARQRRERFQDRICATLSRRELKTSGHEWSSEGAKTPGRLALPIMARRSKRMPKAANSRPSAHPDMASKRLSVSILPDDPPRVSAQRNTNRHFPRTDVAAGQQQVGNIRAGDQKNQGYGAQEEDQHRTNISHANLPSGVTRTLHFSL